MKGISYRKKYDSGSAINFRTGKVGGSEKLYVIDNSPEASKFIYSLPARLRKYWKGGGADGYYVEEPIIKYIKKG